MTFTPLQIGVTFLSFFITVVIAYLWHRVDKKSEHKLTDVESFSVLMSVFFWSAFLALSLKMLIDLGSHYTPQIMQTQWMFVVSIALEEFTKAVALIIGLNIAGKKFNELSDGVMYAVLSALGFVFFENIVYLLTFTPNLTDFLITFTTRNIFSFAAHLSIVFFGVFYASAYLNPDSALLKKLKQRGESRISPYRMDRMLKFLWDKFSFLTILWIPVSPFLLLYHIATSNRKSLTLSEMLIGGFLLSVYVHVGYNLTLGLDNSILHSTLFLVFGSGLVFLFHFFPKIDPKKE